MRRRLQPDRVQVRIRRVRQRRCLTREQVAAVMEIPVSRVEGWELDFLKPTRLELEMLAHLFRVEVEMLIPLPEDQIDRHWFEQALEDVLPDTRDLEAVYV